MNRHFLGIDYGVKRVGVAVADGTTRIATPLQTLDVVGMSAISVATAVAAIAHERAVGTVVIGESKDFQGAENAIMKKIRLFAEALAKELGEGTTIVFEPEFLTSHQAEQSQGKHALLDASAAALILQSYLDRNLL